MSTRGAGNGGWCEVWGCGVREGAGLLFRETPIKLSIGGFARCGGVQGAGCGAAERGECGEREGAGCGGGVYTRVWGGTGCEEWGT